MEATGSEGTLLGTGGLPLSILKSSGGKLVPFIKTLALYFVIFIPEDRPSWAAVGIKCLPILSLALFVILHGVGHPQLHRFNRQIVAGLLFSCIGDAFLVWPSYFLQGMAAFAVAQVFYIRAFGFECLNLKLGATIYALCSSVLFVIGPGIMAETWTLAIGVFVYSSLLITMVWRAVDRMLLSEESWSWSKLSGCVGALSFLISDLMLSMNKFYAPIPHHQVVIMGSYYLAQLAITLSILSPTKPTKAHLKNN